MNVHNFENEGGIAVSVETTSTIPKIDRMEHTLVVEAPFSHRSVYNRLAQAVDKAVASTGLAYEFAPSSYTAEALSDAVAVQTLLGWVNDLSGGDQ
jgi:hypothetical protein